MTLNQSQMLYLLYVVAYAKEGTITRSQVKSHLPRQYKAEASLVCDQLLWAKYLSMPKRGRIELTQIGREALIEGIKTSTYVSRSKVVNALMSLIKPPQGILPYGEFVSKMEALYLEERRQQELSGVVAIKSTDLCNKFTHRHNTPISLVVGYFNQLKSDGLVFAAKERDTELIQWVY